MKNFAGMFRIYISHHMIVCFLGDYMTSHDILTNIIVTAYLVDQS